VLSLYSAAVGCAVEMVRLVLVLYTAFNFLPFKVLAKSLARCSPSAVSGGSLLGVAFFSACRAMYTVLVQLANADRMATNKIL
jgi:hypothetical protein